MGRKLTGGALKLGSLAALGGVAYKAYQNWQAIRPGPRLRAHLRGIWSVPLPSSAAAP